MNKELHKVKYLHILWHPDVKFNPKFVNMINNGKRYFNSQDHLFITPHKNVYDTLKEYSNVICVEGAEKNLINKFGEYADWIFVHSLNCSRLRLIFTRNKYARKVIWRTWGHDVRPFEYYRFNGLKKLCFKIIWILYIKKVKMFRAIGVANDIDICNFKNTFGDMDFVKINYAYDPKKDELLEKFKNNEDNKCNSTFKILIGHSGSEWNRHIEAMNAIKKYANENIKVCLILSYNVDIDYLNKVKKVAYQYFGDKLEIVENFMPYYDYIAYLSNVDCAFLLQKHSSGLGNLSWLLFFDKPVFFSDDSDFVKAFNLKKISFLDINDIKNMNFQEFSSSKNSSELKSEFGNISTSAEKCMHLSDFLGKL